MKKLRKLLVLVASLCMVLGMAISANADAPAVSKITLQTLKMLPAKADNSNFYVNTEAPYFTIQYQWEAKGSAYESYGVENPWVPNFRVVSATGTVARYDKVVPVTTVKVQKKSGKVMVDVPDTYLTTAKVVFRNANVGKTKITLSLPNESKLKISTTLTLKSYSDNIKVTGAADDATVVTLAPGAKLNLAPVAYYGGAKATVFATTTAYDYDKTSTTYKTDVAAAGKIASVSGSGSIAAKSVGEVPIVITSKDGKVVRRLTIKVVAPEVNVLKVVDEKTNKSLQKTAVTLSAGDKAANKTAEVILQGDYKSLDQLSFVSSNTKVATVDAKGKITGVSNGTAKITVSPKLGNVNAKNKVEISVKVETDVESITWNTIPTVLNNGKGVKFSSYVNASASKKSIKYTIESIHDKDGNLVDKKDWAKYASVSGTNTGTISGKQVCTVEIKAAATTLVKNVTFNSYQTVEVIKQCPNIEFYTYKVDKGVTKIAKKTTAYTLNNMFTGALKDDGSSDEEDVVINLYASNAVPQLNPELKAYLENEEGSVTVTTDKGDGATFDPLTGELKVFAGYHTKEIKLTVKANDGTNKKATFTIKNATYVSDVFVETNSNETVTEGEGEAAVTYPVVVIEANKKTDVTKLISGSVNWNADTQGVTYKTTDKVGGKNASLTAAVLTPEQSFKFTVTSKGKTKGTNGKDGVTVTKTVVVKALASEEVAAAEEVTVVPSIGKYVHGTDVGETVNPAIDNATNETLALYYEDTVKTGADVVSSADGKNVLDSRVTYTFVDYKNGVAAAKANKASAYIKIVNGEIKPVKAGKVDVIVTSVAYPTKSAKFTVVVSQKTADVKKTYNTLFANTLKEEDVAGAYGVKPTFTVKGDLATLKLDVLKPGMTVEEWRGNGAKSIVARPEFANIKSVTVLADGEYPITYDRADIKSIADVIAGDMSDTPLLKLVGDCTPLRLTVVAETEGIEFEYVVPVDVVISASAASIESYLDEVAVEIEKLVKADENYDENEAILSYNTVTNTINVEIVNENYDLAANLEKFKATYNRVLDQVGNDLSLRTVVGLADDVAISLEKEVDGAPVVYDCYRENLNAIDRNIDRLLTEERLAKLAGKTLSSLDGAVGTVDLHGVLIGSGFTDWNAVEVDYKLTVNFIVSEAAYEKKSDAKIAETIADKPALSYDAETKTVNVTIDAVQRPEIEDLEGLGLGSTFSALKGEAVSAEIVAIDGAVTKITGAENLTTNTIACAIFNQKALNLKTATSTLKDKQATVKVTFANGYSIIYTINFDITGVTPSTSTEDADVSENEEAIEETPADENEEAPAEEAEEATEEEAEEVEEVAEEVEESVEDAE